MTREDFAFFGYRVSMLHQTPDKGSSDSVHRTRGNSEKETEEAWLGSAEDNGNRKPGQALVSLSVECAEGFGVFN